MEILLYFGKVILTSGVMFLYYRLFLKDKTFHHYNRFYLLGAILVSVLLPIVKVSYFTMEVNNDLYLLIRTLKNENINTVSHDVNYFRIFSLGFGIVSIFFLGRFLFGIIKISKFKNRFPKEKFEGINFYQTNLNQAPFSYFRNLFWKSSITVNSELGRQILKHEMVHIEQNHTLDKFFTEILRAIFWFNPFFYLIKKEIHLIHEYLADKKTVKNSDTKAFAQMLLASHFSGNILPATSPFLSSNLKKRLNMLKKPKTRFSYIRRISALPLLFMIGFVFLVNAKNREIKAVNIQIAQAVQEIKKDTVKAIDVPVTKLKVDSLKKTPPLAEKLLNEENIKGFTKEIQKKSAQLKSLSPISKEFSEKIDEMNSLIGKTNEIATSEPERRKVWILSGNSRTLNSDEIRKDGENIIIEVNSPDWKKQLKEIEKLKVDVAFTENAADTFRTRPRIFFQTDKDKIQFNTAQQARKLRKLLKEKAELAQKQKELSKKYAEIAHEKLKFYADANRVQAPKNTSTFYFNSKDIGNATMPKNTRYYLDDKEITKEEMNVVKPNDIASIYINKNKNNDKDEAEIRIKTKK